MAKKKSFTEKQKRFCQEYIIDLNGSAAAVRAGYSAKTAKEQAVELLNYPAVKNHVASLQEKIAKKLDITAEMVLAELAKIGFSNIQDYLDDANGVGNIKGMDKEKAGAISAFEITPTKEGDAIKFKLHDKIAALEKIAKHIGFFEKDNKQQSAADSTIKVEIVMPDDDQD